MAVFSGSINLTSGSVTTNGDVISVLSASGSTMFSLIPAAGPGIAGSSLTASVFLGEKAAAGVTGARWSNFIGNSAGSGSSGAARSNFMGLLAGANSPNASNSNFLGSSAGLRATDASNSNFIGSTAGQDANGANNSSFIGAGAGAGATNAYSSVFLGDGTGGGAVDANKAIMIGFSTGTGAIIGSYSTIIGYKAGRMISGNGIGSNNIIIGTNVTLPNDVVDSINIGGILFATGSYFSETVTYSGSMQSAKVGIATPTPSATLDVSGSLNVSSGSITFAGLVLQNYTDDAAAAAAGIPVGGLYRNGNIVSIRIS